MAADGLIGINSNLRTRIKRLVRRTLCFSKTEQMHDLVMERGGALYNFWVRLTP